MYQQPSIDIHHLLIKSRTALSFHTTVLPFLFSSFAVSAICRLRIKPPLHFPSTSPYLKRIRGLTSSVFVPSNYYRISFNFSFRHPVNILNKIVTKSSDFGFILDLFEKCSPCFASRESRLDAVHVARHFVSVIQRYALPCLPNEAACIERISYPSSPY